MLVLPLARRPSSGGSCPSECPSEGARSPVFDSNYGFDLGGAKRARTADLLHAMNHPHGWRRRHTLHQLGKR